MNSDIQNFRLTPLTNPKYITASLAQYSQNSISKNWEVIKAHDSVAILIYHTTNDSFVLVKQFRPAVYMHNSDGTTIELCAGILDKECSIEQTAKEEILEECGYEIELNHLRKVTSFYTSVGFAGSKQTLFYVEVDETKRVSDGGGIDDEQIEVVELSTCKANEFIFDQSIAKTPGLMFAFLWWQNNKR